LSLNKYFSDLRGKRVAVIGAGVSNRPLIRLLLTSGIDVTICDKSGIEAMGDFYREITPFHPSLCLGDTYLNDLDADVVFRTPGIHPNTPAFVKAREKGTLITSEMEVFFSLCPCRTIAVTGSDGKTTTTTLISELLKTGGYHVWLGGNIGTPLLAETDAMAPTDVAVLELSSFQLHSMSCSPDVAVVTNVSPNHLDVHPTYQDYIDAKKQIFRNQKPGARLVLNRDNEVTASFAAETTSEIYWFSRRQTVDRGFWTDADGMIRRAGGQIVMPASDIRIPGVHNTENMMAAFAAVDGLVGEDVFRSVARNFPGVPHRLETVRVLRGVTYINDSIASSPSRTAAGLSCFKEKVILIAGGKDKGVPFDSLGDDICRHVKSLYLTGWTAEKLKDAAMNSPLYAPGKPDIHVIDGFRDTVEAAARRAEAGDIVLLSPACTSFDRFKNFEERGKTFRKIVEGLE